MAEGLISVWFSMQIRFLSIGQEARSGLEWAEFIDCRTFCHVPKSLARRTLRRLFQRKMYYMHGPAF